MNVTTTEMDRLFAIVPGDEATRILSFADALEVFASASDKQRVKTILLLNIIIVLLELIII